MRIESALQIFMMILQNKHNSANNDEAVPDKSSSTGKMRLNVAGYNYIFNSWDFTFNAFLNKRTT